MDVRELMLAFFVCFYKIVFHILEAFYRFIFPKTYDVKGKVVLITGSAGGLGRLVAMKLGQLGCKLILWDINEEQNNETARLVRLSSSQGAEAHPMKCDVTNKEAVYKLAEEVKEKVGNVDILINNAGIVQGKSFLDGSDETMIKTFQVNTFSNFWTCKAFLPSMIERNSGHIVTISSIAGLFPAAGLADYCGSKFASYGFHHSLMLELVSQKLDGIFGTVVCPFFINTGMFDGVKPPFPLLEADYSADRIVAGILERKEEVVFPAYFNFLRSFFSVLPLKAVSAIFLALEGPKIMESFKGH